MFPQVPVRQWVVTFPRRLRFFLHRDLVLLGRVLRYCARPAFASERLSGDGSGRPVRYRLTKPLTTPRALAPRARDPRELHAGFACAFDQSP